MGSKPETRKRKKNTNWHQRLSQKSSKTHYFCSVKMVPQEVVLFWTETRIMTHEWQCWAQTSTDAKVVIGWMCNLLPSTCHERPQCICTWCHAPWDCCVHVCWASAFSGTGWQSIFKTNCWQSFSKGVLISVLGNSSMTMVRARINAPS